MDAKVESTPRAVNPRPAPRLVFALTQYSVEKRGTKWYYAKTTHHYQGVKPGQSKTWHGPYKSLHTVTFAIATALKLEANTRHHKLCAGHGIVP